MRDIVVIAHNLRSCHNVGSLLRTADGIGVSRVYLTGYTPYPSTNPDARLPHEARKIDRLIQKTALGATVSQPWEHRADIYSLITELVEQGYQVVAIEQAQSSISLTGFVVPDRIALLVGREVEGVEPAVLAQMHQIVEIPMFGQKESFNVVQAAAMALYHCRFSEVA
jgi:23S rRNA (guanosine2251-2'-O)-methyltransferase